MMLRGETLARVEHYVGLVVAAVSRGDWPLKLPVYERDEIMTWGRETQRRKCLLLFHLLAKSHALLRTDTTSTKRYCTRSDDKLIIIRSTLLLRHSTLLLVATVQL